MNEKREFNRKKITINVEYDISKDQKWLDSTAENISAGGMCLVTQHAMAINSTVNLKFIMPEMKQPIFVAGKVMWHEKFLKKNNEENFFNGIQFTNIKRDERNLINKYVESTTFDRK